MPSPQLNSDKFEKLIDRRGRPVAWEEAAICSCWNMDSGQPSYACQACKGKGYVYQEATEANALVTSITLSKDFQEMAGMFEVGDAVMTVPKHIVVPYTNGELIDNPMFDIGLWDKITLLDDTYKTSEVLTRGVSMFGREPDTLTNKAEKIKYIRRYNQQTGEAIDYKFSIDYVIINSVAIEWIDNDNTPSIGEQYSVTYFHKPTYVVAATLPKPRHQDEQDLPRYVALRYLAPGIDRK